MTTKSSSLSSDSSCVIVSVFLPDEGRATTFHFETLVYLLKGLDVAKARFTSNTRSRCKEAALWGVEVTSGSDLDSSCHHT